MAVCINNNSRCVEVGLPFIGKGETPFWFSIPLKHNNMSIKYIKLYVGDRRWEIDALRERNGSVVFTCDEIYNAPIVNNIKRVEKNAIMNDATVYPIILHCKHVNDTPTIKIGINDKHANEVNVYGLINSISAYYG